LRRQVPLDNEKVLRLVACSQRHVEKRDLRRPDPIAATALRFARIGTTPACLETFPPQSLADALAFR
jgi:hypothetical protein